LGNRRIAILLTVVVAVVATLFGVHRSLTRASRDIERMFYDGIYLKDDGYLRPGINAQLGNMAESALNVATLLQRYPKLEAKSESLLSARRELLRAHSIDGKSSACTKMGEALYDLLISARDADLAEGDAAAVARYFSDYKGAEIYINFAPYNDKVVEYKNGKNFIASALGAFMNVKDPGYFSLNAIPMSEYP
jgi:hypothetical protein